MVYSFSYCCLLKVWGGGRPVAKHGPSLKAESRAGRDPSLRFRMPVSRGIRRLRSEICPQNSASFLNCIKWMNSSWVLESEAESRSPFDAKRLRISHLLLEKSRNLVCRDAHQRAGYGVSGVVVAAVDGGQRHAGGEEQEQCPEPRCMLADGQRYGSDRRYMSAGEDAGLHAVMVEQPEIPLAQQRRDVRPQHVREQQPRRGERKEGINGVTEEGGQEYRGPKVVQGAVTARGGGRVVSTNCLANAWAVQAAEKRFEIVILSEAKNLALCILRKIRRARSFAEFTFSGQSQILRFAQNDSKGLRMTTQERFSAACVAPAFCRQMPPRWRRYVVHALAGQHTSRVSLRCKTDCGNSQRHQRVAKQISKFQVVLKPRRSGLQQHIDEVILQQDSVPADKYAIKMMGGIGSEQQARFSIGDQEQQCGKQVGSGGKPWRALTISAERHEGGECHQVERHDDGEFARGQMEHNRGECDVSEKCEDNQFGNGKTDSDVGNRRNLLGCGQSHGGGCAHGICSRSTMAAVAEHHVGMLGLAYVGLGPLPPPGESVYYAKPSFSLSF